MHLLLTDVLTCPRCGPAFGLILLANRIEDRRVIDGVLGCANCREQYAIRDGVADFGGPPAPVATADAGAVMRIAALLGVTGGPGFIVVVGPAANVASALSALLEDVEVVAAGYGDPAGSPAGSRSDDTRARALADAPGVSRLAIAGRTLPLAGGRILGVLLSGEAADALLEEGARVLSPVARLVLEPASADAVERLAAVGLRVLARDAQTVVAARE